MSITSLSDAGARQRNVNLLNFGDLVPREPEAAWENGIRRVRRALPDDVFFGSTDMPRRGKPG